MALIDRDPSRDAADPPHHHCALAMLGAFALMLAAAPLAIWLVDTAFAAMPH